jgi:hypothetical protein
MKGICLVVVLLACGACGTGGSLEVADAGTDAGADAGADAGVCPPFRLACTNEGGSGAGGTCCYKGCERAYQEVCNDRGNRCSDGQCVLPP